jgi:hypothetical protein
VSAAALLKRQRENMTYFEGRIQQLDDDDALSNGQRDADRSARADHAFEVIEILKAVPLATRADFFVVFSELARLSRLQPRGGGWEVRATSGEWLGVRLTDVGLDFSIESLRSRTEANALRFLRCREALRGRQQSDADDSLGGAVPFSPEPDASRVEGDAPAHDNEGLEAAHNSALRHHERSLRRRFSELFSGVEFAGPAARWA